MNRLSVIIPVYNGEQTISRAIDSALAQRFEGAMEIVVVNDGSTDSTAEVLEYYREHYGSKVNTITQPRRGPVAARNAGVAASSGEYIAFLDADDAWRPGYLARTCAALDANPDAALAFTDIEKVDENGNRAECSPVGRAPSLQDLLTRAWGIYPSAVLMRRAVFSRCGGFCAEFRELGFEEVYMWLLARECGEFVYVAEPLVIYRCPDWAAIVDKYEPGREVFNRLMRQRYGSAAEPVIDYWRSIFAGGIVLRALTQMGSGDWREVWRSLTRLLSLGPLYLLRFRNLRRLFRKRRLKLMPGVVLNALLHRRSKTA